MRLCNSLRLGIYFYVTCCFPLYLAFARDTGLAEDNDQSSPGRQLLAGPNFRISARTSMLKPGGYFSLSEEIVTEEFYSNSQQRALVQLHRDDYDDIPHSVYHYQDSRIVRNSLHDRKKCDAIIEDELTKELFGKLLIAKDWLKKRVAVPDYVIGLARLLFIVDYHRHALIKASEVQPVMIRNHKTLQYELPTTEEDSFGLEGRLRIYYAETEDHFGGFDLPIRIIFRDKNIGLLVVDYSFVGAMDEDIIEHSVDNLNPLDFFALPVGINCSENLPLARNGVWLVKRVQVASFKAEIFKHNALGTKQISISKRFVAYDSYAGVMRSDAITSTSYSTTIVDFWNMKKYNILNDAETNGLQRCVSSIVLNIAPYKEFLPLDQLIYMGRAIVRGIDCYAFEHITKQLPPALFPLLVYTNLDGKEEAIFGRDSNTYSVVYYFAAGSELKEGEEKRASIKLPAGPLMRIDVYCKKLLQYHMDIYDYVNQLVDAPNGDQQEELFAVKDHCTSGGLGTYGYASLSLEMVYEPKSATPKTSKEIMEIFQSQHLRNKAVLRAVARGAAGIVTKLSDLETRMRLSSSGELTFYLEAQLDVPDIEVTEVRQVGWSSVKLPSSEVKTIEECFQLAAHARSASNAVLFVSCANSCAFDPAPNIEYESDGRTIKSITSDIYNAKRSRSHPCPAMLIDSKEKRQTETSLAALRQTFLWLHSGFDGKTLRMLMPHEGMFDCEDDSMLFEVTKVDISNDKWSTALGYEKAHQDDTLRAAAIDGLGLTVTNGQLQVPRQREASPEEEPTMSYQMCHSICMANMSCRSFSICITRWGIECITSEVDFRDESLLDEIDEQVKAQSKDESLKSKTITVPNPKRTKQKKDDENKDDNLDGEWEEPGAGYEQIELKIDFRCKLYKKNVLEVFLKLPSIRLMLKNSALKPVSSQEQCAEVCLQNNIVFFKKMAQTRLELSRNNQEELNDEELVKRIRDEYNTNLMGWCSTFHYLDSSSSNIDNEAKAYIEPEKLSKTGLCVIARSDSIRQKPPKADGTTAVAEKLGPRITFESFQFLYSNLFDIQYGVSLVAEDKDDQGKPLPMINKSLREYAQRAESCAQRCFLQTSGLKPWCKSFDFIIYRDRDPAAKYISPTIVNKYCQFHSLSLTEIRSNGMVDFMVTDLAAEAAQNNDTSLDIQSWHYDSRESYTLEDAVLSELVLVKSETTLVNEIQSYRLHTLGIMAILLTAMLLSTAVVYLHGESMVNKFSATRRDSISHPPRSFLSSLVPGSVPSSSSSIGFATTIGSSIRHKRFVAGDQELPDIPELSSI